MGALAADCITDLHAPERLSYRVLVPADKIAFVEFSTDQARRVGFGNIV